jgi:putative SOS response-associated peptidase YedK
VPVVFPTAAPNLEPRDNIWPTETAPVFRQRDQGVELVQLRWGFPPARPVINFRSEGRRFPKGRCLIPASHFFEFGDLVKFWARAAVSLSIGSRRITPIRGRGSP